MPATLTTTAPHTASITFAAARDRQLEVSPSARAIAFIDSAVDDSSMLVDGVLPDIKVVVLSSDRDGIAQITETLQTLSGVASVYIVAHGAPGYLKLGNSELSLESCDRYASQLRTWFDADDSQLLLYACNVAAGDAGAEFLTKLQGLVGGAIAASTHKVGASDQNGSWNLDTFRPETDSQTLISGIPFTTQVIEKYQSVLATFVVTNTNNKGLGSLRQAVLDANTNLGADVITFGGSVFTDTTPDIISIQETYDFPPSVPVPILSTISTLPITDDLTIEGTGANLLTVESFSFFSMPYLGGSPNPTTSLFNISAGVKVGISKLTETLSDGFARGVYNAGTLTLSDVVIKDFVFPNSRSTQQPSSRDNGAGILNVGTLTVVNSTISGNTTDTEFDRPTRGGGIYNSGTLNVIGSNISRNFANAQGGGIYNSGTATITDTAIDANSLNDSSYGGSASGGTQGAGIYNAVGGILTISSSAITGNGALARSTSVGSGGGISNQGAAVISNSTIAGNSITGSTAEGSGISNRSGNMTISNSTITGNTARQRADNTIATGGISSFLGTVTIQNSIVAGNFTPVSLPFPTPSPLAPDVSGNFVDNGFNLIGDNTNSTGFTTSTLVGTGTNPIDPKLAPLANNGGKTLTASLLSNSPAINAGSNSLISADVTDLDGDGNVTELLPFDQRGSGFDRVVSGTVDIGAFEGSVVTTNNSPTAVNDVVTVAAGVSTNINVLANDSDPDGDPLTLSIAIGCQRQRDF
jgi:hypothetical protein